MSNETNSIEHVLSTLEKLDEESDVSEKRETLTAFGEAAVALPPGDRGLLLAEAQHVLSWMQAPVRTLKSYVDQAAEKTGTGEQDANGSGQTLGYTDPTPAEEPVDGADLLEELAATFRRYVVLPKGAPAALALWTLWSFCFREFTVAPILAITSPTKRCGKSTLLHLLEALVARPQMASNITAAAVYRVVEQAQPTLLIDEADSFMDRGSRLRNVLNAGHLETGQVVLCSGDDHAVRRFSAHSPKAIALIGELPSTIEDRSVSIGMRRKRPGEEVQKLHLDRIRHECRDLRRQMARWVQDHSGELDTTDTDVPEELDDRSADNWRPLLAIAERVGGMWTKRAQSAARMLSGGEQGRETEAAIELLRDIHAVFCNEDQTRIRSRTLAEKLGELEARPWATWSNGKSITQNALAQLLRPFDIRPRGLWFGTGKESGSNYRGYERADFQDAFLRYGITEEAGAREPQEAA